MAAGDLLVVPWQIELNGLLMGPSTNFVVKEFSPWTAPTIRAGGQEQARGSWGSNPGVDDLGDRLVPAKLLIAGSSYADVQASRRLLAAAWMPPASGVVVLVWMEDDLVKYRLSGKPQLSDSMLEPNVPTDARFLAVDPRIYLNAESSVAASLGSAPSGLTFNAAANFSFGGPALGGAMNPVNAGTIAAPWTATFTGPIVDPAIYHNGQSASVRLVGSLAAGETLVVDSASKTVILNGTASRYNWVSSATRWFMLDPGANSLTFAATSGAGSCTLAWRSALM